MKLSDIESFGYCTRNENGDFEVNFELKDSLISRFSNKKRKFKFYTTSYEIKYIPYLSEHCGKLYDWYNEDGGLVTNIKVLNIISNIINATVALDRQVIWQPKQQRLFLTTSI